MRPGQGEDGTSHLGVRVPTNFKSAVEKTAYDLSTPHQKVTKSEIMREALSLWFQFNINSIPEEAKDDLDDDLVSNAGSGSLKSDLVVDDSVAEKQQEVSP